MKSNYFLLKYQTAKEWLFKHPKQFFRYGVTIILLSLAISFIQFFFFPSSVSVVKKTNLPSMLEKSDKVKEEYAKKENSMEAIVKELEELSIKRNKKLLNKEDSLRIEYLFNQYQKLKK